MRKKYIWVIVILVILISVLVGLKKSGALGGQEGVKVTAEQVTSKTITEIVTASGKIFPEVEVKVSPDISGEVVELMINEGDSVKKGQTLARIYADIYASIRDQAMASVSQSQAQVENARSQMGAIKATLDQTEAAYNRQKQLYDQKVISANEFELAQQAYYAARANYAAAQDGIKANQANVASAQASLARASKDVGRTTISAPMDGVVSLLAVKKGERVVGTAQMAGTEMMRIADLSSIETQVDVGENDIPKVKIGDTAIVTIDAYSKRKFKGVVYKIANPMGGGALTSTTVTNYKVHIRLLTSSYQDLLSQGKSFPFRPNMTASADIQTTSHYNVLAVPLNAVTTRDTGSDNKDSFEGKSGPSKGSNSQSEQSTADDDSNTEEEKDGELQEVVYVLQPDNTVKKVVVTTDIQDINYIEIRTGLKAGDMVITGPFYLVSKDLKTGDKVTVVSKAELLEELKKDK
jgi:HlyD family secretion protein